VSDDVPEPVRRAVLERDTYQCVACGTGGENRLQLHHLRFRSAGGGHDPTNLATVCFRCHRLIHLGVLAVALVEVWPGEFHPFCRRTRTPSRAPVPSPRSHP
jgi:hypothetical protein